MGKKKKKSQPVQARKTLKERLAEPVPMDPPTCPFLTPAGFALPTNSKSRQVERGSSRKRKHKGQIEE